jgi:hypothetical protein
VIAAVMLATVGLLTKQQNAEQVRRWTRARSVSEAIKTEMFYYLTRIGAYSGKSADRHLEAEVQRLERKAGDLAGETQSAEPRTRQLPAVNDLESYLELRVRESELEGYYKPNALAMRQRLRIAKGVEIGLALAAGGLAATTVVSPTVGAWAAVATTASGAIVAHAASERYEYLWIEYSRTASELQRLLERRTASNGRPLSDSELIAKCEDVISIQNQGWMAKWGEDGRASGS